MEKNTSRNREFENLTLGYAGQLFRLAYARVPTRQDAQDIVQETYLKDYRSFGKFREEASIKTWLTQILLNCVTDHFRKGARALATIDLDDVIDCSDFEPYEPGPEERLCDRQIDPALQAALEAMPETMLTPLLLKEIHDATYDEIADMLDVPRGTVMSRLFRARALLRKQLAPHSKGKNTAGQNSADFSSPNLPSDASRGAFDELQ